MQQDRHEGDRRYRPSECRHAFGLVRLMRNGRRRGGWKRVKVNCHATVKLIAALDGRAGGTTLGLSLVPPEETVEGLLLADLELTTLDTGVIDTEEGVDVVHGLRADVRELLDLGGDVLDLGVVEGKTQLLDTRLDGIPSGQTMTNGNVASQTEIFGLEDLVCAGVVEDGLGVNTGLVGEGTVASNGVHEGDVDLDSLGDQVLDLSEHGEVVLGLDILRVGGVEARNETTKRGDTNTLTNTKNGGIDVGRTSLQGGVGIGNSHTGIVVKMDLNIAAYNAPEGPDKVIDLAGVGASDGIGDTDTVDTNFVDGLVDGEEIDEI